MWCKEKQVAQCIEQHAAGFIENQEAQSSYTKNHMAQPRDRHAKLCIEKRVAQSLAKWIAQSIDKQGEAGSYMSPKLTSLNQMSLEGRGEPRT